MIKTYLEEACEMELYEVVELHRPYSGRNLVKALRSGAVLASATRMGVGVWCNQVWELTE